jgi:hypothetical protein
VRNITLIMFAVAALSGGSAVAQGQAQGPSLACAASLELPTRGLLASGAGTSGVVEATVHIGSGGHPAEVKLTGGNGALQGEVRVALSLSTFAEDCEGRDIKLVYAFELQDPATDSIVPPAVRFVWPNRFEFVFRRVKPSIDHANTKQ